LKILKISNVEFVPTHTTHISFCWSVLTVTIIADYVTSRIAFLKKIPSSNLIG